MKYLIILLALSVNLSAFGQVEDGSIAPDFTLVDWNGNTHNLYSYLDEDKTVFLKIFAVHCPSCWAYHQSEKLKHIYNDFGPEGTDEIMVLALEHDEYNGENEWSGIGDPWVTQGNWLEGTPYPQFNVEWPDRDVFIDYNVNFYPVIYKICPDKLIERISTSVSEDVLYEKAQECQIVSVEEQYSDWNVFYNQDSRNVIVDHSQTLKSLSIINLQGQVVKTIDSISNSTIDVSDLENGVYLFEFKTETGSVVEKLYLY